MENPSDTASRGSTSAKLGGNLAWWEGPKWLHGPQDYWPMQPALSEPTEDCLSEIKLSETKALCCVEGESTVALERIIAWQKYGKLSRLLCITALGIRLVDILEKKWTHENDGLQRNSISSEEIDHAERL